MSDWSHGERKSTRQSDKTQLSINMMVKTWLKQEAMLFHWMDTSSDEGLGKKTNAMFVKNKRYANREDLVSTCSSMCTNPEACRCRHA